MAGLTFTVAGVDATFNRSTGRSKPVRRGSGAFASETYVAVDADSERARDVLGAAMMALTRAFHPTDRCRRSLNDERCS